MTENWFWAWRRLKYGESANDQPFSDRDKALVSALISAIMWDEIPRGDGKFSRLDNYIKGIRKECEWIKRNFTGRDEILTAFYMGVEVTFEVLDRIAEKIKKGR